MLYYVHVKLRFRERNGVGHVFVGTFQRLKHRASWHVNMLEAAVKWHGGDVSIEMVNRKKRHFSFALSPRIHPRSLIAIVEREYQELLYQLELGRLGVRNPADDEDDWC